MIYTGKAYVKTTRKHFRNSVATKGNILLLILEIQCFLRFLKMKNDFQSHACSLEVVIYLLLWLCYIFTHYEILVIFCSIRRYAQKELNMSNYF